MNIQPKPGSHLYNRGYLGLIPVIGAFIGAGLFILGAVKYKNRTLMLIGIVAIVPTFIIYGSIYFSSFTSTGLTQWTNFNKPNLDQLVKNIEFYKKEYGKYPDSLEQLKEDDMFLMINDPTQTFTKSKYGTKYIYKNEGKYYILFALGVDGIPFTKDDIFPYDRYFDSTLTGLKHPDKTFNLPEVPKR